MHCKWTGSDESGGFEVTKKTTELVKPDKQDMTPVQNDSTAIIQMIERAATNPDVDIEKMERLLVMVERMNEQKAEAAFNAAMSTAQAEMRQVSVDAENPQTDSKYASYSALDKVLRPIYTKHGFSLSFDTGIGAEDNWVRVICIVSHIAGFSRSPHVDLPADGLGPKGSPVMTRTHATGGAMTYGMRYLLKMIFNVAVSEDDNDGNQPLEYISEEQALTIQSMIDENGINMDAFKKWMSTALKCNSIAEITTITYDTVIHRIGSAIRAQGKTT